MSTDTTIPPVRAFVTELVNEGWVIVPKELLEPLLRVAPLPNPTQSVFTVWRSTDTEGEYLVSCIEYPSPFVNPVRTERFIK